MTLLNATNANVCKNKAKVKSYGAMPRLEKPNINNCGIVGICPHNDDEILNDTPPDAIEEEAAAAAARPRDK